MIACTRDEIDEERVWRCWKSTAIYSHTEIRLKLKKNVETKYATHHRNNDQKQNKFTNRKIDRWLDILTNEIKNTYSKNLNYNKTKIKRKRRRISIWTEKKNDWSFYLFVLLFYGKLRLHIHTKSRLIFDWFKLYVKTYLLELNMSQSKYRARRNNSNISE